MSFNDLEKGVSEIDKVFSDITRNIFSVSSHVGNIQKLVVQFGTPTDNHSLRERMHNETESARKLVKGTNDKFKILEKLSGIDNRQKQMQKSKLTKDFQAVLKRFQDVQKLAAEKGKISVSMAKATSFDLQNRIPDQTDDDKSGLLKYEALQKQRVEIENEVNFNEAVIAEREAGIKEIESTILEVNEIFRDLGTIVNEQQSMFDSIESNVEHTTIRTEGAAKELDRANEYQKRARAKMCCLITIIIAIGVIVLVVVLNL